MSSLHIRGLREDRGTQEYCPDQARCHVLNYVTTLKADVADVGGENVYCSEVEAVLSAHSQVLQAAVFGMPNSVMGEMVHAAIVLRKPSSTPVTPQQLIAWCQSQLALYKSPTAVHIVNELPTTGSGKVMKNVLRATFTRGSGPAAAAPATAAATAHPAAAASAAATMPASAGPLLAVAAAAAEAAVDVVAAHRDQSASDAHTPFRGTCTGEHDRDADMLDAIRAQCPGACVLGACSDGLVMDSGECYLLVVGDWATAVTQVPPCAMCIGKAALFVVGIFV